MVYRACRVPLEMHGYSVGTSDLHVSGRRALDTVIKNFAGHCSVHGVALGGLSRFRFFFFFFLRGWSAFSFEMSGWFAGPQSASRGMKRNSASPSSMLKLNCLCM